MLIAIILSLLFIVLGIVLSTGKGSFLIAGVNTMSKEEKEKYDLTAMCKFMGKSMFVIAVAMLLLVFENEVLDIISIILSIGFPIFIVIYANTGNRFKK